MDMLRTYSAACAAVDLTARLHAELTEALARLAITTARTHNILSRGEAVPTDLTNARILQAEQVEVLRQLLNGVPSVEGDEHAASA